MRHRVQLLQGQRRKRRRTLLSGQSFTPARAEFWTSLPFSDFLPEIAAEPDHELDRQAWTAAFDERRRTAPEPLDALEQQEAAVVASGSAFGQRLAQLLEQHAEWPFVRSDLRCGELLAILQDDPQPGTADVYWSLSRGVSLLPPEEAAAFRPVTVENYASAAEHSDRVTAEIERLLAAGFIQPWPELCAEVGLDPDQQPAAVLAVGAVERNGKIRIVIDGSAPRGRSVNDSIEPPATVLPTIAFAMRAMALRGLSWRSDLEDAFLQSALAKHSVPLSAIRWNGTLYGYRRLGFGFRSGPAHQQSFSVALLRALVRQLRAQGLFAHPVAGCDQQYPQPPTRPAQRLQHAVAGLPAFLDDFAGFSTTRAAAWYSFACFLHLALRINLRISFKPGKTEAPAALMEYLGFMTCTDTLSVFLSEKRVAAIREKLAAVAGAPRVTVRDMMSLVGTLVFASVVIRIGRTHYREMIDSIVALGPRPRPSALITVSAGLRSAIETWHMLLQRINVRSARTVITRPRVPGELTTDASFAGYGWAGLGRYDYGPWPADWQERIGQHATREHRRIFICELELWALLYAVRALAPRCVGCRLHARVDNMPVVGMVRRLSTASSRCLPALRELAWLLATFDVELICTHITTTDNLVADVLSRRHSPDLDEAVFMTVLRWLSAKSHDPVWQSWPEQPPARPELFEHLPVALPDSYSGALLQIDAEEMDSLLPHYLRTAADRAARRRSSP